MYKHLNGDIEEETSWKYAGMALVFSGLFGIAQGTVHKPKLKQAEESTLNKPKAELLKKDRDIS